jgi:hypothetical protein
MSAAYAEKKSAAVVVDAGTAVTIDVLDKTGQHIGGQIIPVIRPQRQRLAGGREIARIERRILGVVQVLGAELVAHLDEMLSRIGPGQLEPLIVDGHDGYSWSASRRTLHALTLRQMTRTSSRARR